MTGRVLLLLDLGLKLRILLLLFFELGLKLTDVLLEFILLLVGFDLELLVCFFDGAGLPFVLLEVFLYLEDLLKVPLLQFRPFLGEVRLHGFQLVSHFLR